VASLDRKHAHETHPEPEVQQLRDKAETEADGGQIDGKGIRDRRLRGGWWPLRQAGQLQPPTRHS